MISGKKTSGKNTGGKRVNNASRDQENKGDSDDDHLDIDDLMEEMQDSINLA